MQHVRGPDEFKEQIISSLYAILFRKHIYYDGIHKIWTTYELAYRETNDFKII